MEKTAITITIMTNNAIATTMTMQKTFPHESTGSTVSFSVCLSGFVMGEVSSTEVGRVVFTVVVVVGVVVGVVIKKDCWQFFSK